MIVTVNQGFGGIEKVLQRTKQNGHSEKKWPLVPQKRFMHRIRAHSFCALLSGYLHKGIQLI
ncbi:hypothetical protein [Ralstonia wenshanensis]|jgi:hypothetical protein|uniref:hypothetical protein n=1 Tax=Ralstonia wenshanensis TaxID=2842456 RepID=UPI002931F18C|nr:hypothetical protein [Ralstonia wenshanensis]